MPFCQRALCLARIVRLPLTTTRHTGIAGLLQRQTEDAVDAVKRDTFPRELLLRKSSRLSERHSSDLRGQFVRLRPPFLPGSICLVLCDFSCALLLSRAPRESQFFPVSKISYPFSFLILDFPTSSSFYQLSLHFSCHTGLYVGSFLFPVRKVAPRPLFVEERTQKRLIAPEGLSPCSRMLFSRVSSRSSTASGEHRNVPIS